MAMQRTAWRETSRVSKLLPDTMLILPQAPAKTPSMTGFATLPNEILVNIFDLGESSSPQERQDLSKRLRLTCKRFCEVSSHWLAEKTTVDITRPETLQRFNGLARNAAIARGIRQVYLRLHYYNPWMASSIDNFAIAVFMEWQDKIDIYGNVWDAGPTDGVVCAERGMQLFLKESFPEPLHPRRDGVRNVDETSQTVCVLVDELDNFTTQQVFSESYVLYRSKFEKQDAMLKAGGFLKVFAESFAALPECTTHSLTLYDHDLHTNRPSWSVDVDLDSPKLRHNAFVSIISRPMLWEDARWAGTRDDVWCHVPVEILIDVLLEMGKHDGAIIDYLCINLTAAPDYALLKSDVYRLRELTEAVRSIDLFQFRFKADRPGWSRQSSQRAVRSPDEMRALNDYFGAIMAAKTLASFEVDLGDFWESAGLEGIADATAPLGARFDWSFGPEFRSISLYAACMTVWDFERLAKCLPEGVDVGLNHVYLLGGTWAEVLHLLKRTCKTSATIRIDWPLGGHINDEQREHAFASLDGHSRATRFVRGDEISNPLEYLQAA